MKWLHILLIGAGAYAAWHYLLKDMVIFGAGGLSASNPTPEADTNIESGQAVGQVNSPYGASISASVHSIGQNYSGRSFGL